MDCMNDMEPALDREAIRKHYAWRKRVRAGLPSLGMRVFALRTTGYPGSGFHWALERRFGQLLMLVNDYDNPLTFSRSLTEEIVAEEVYRDVARAEQAAIRMERVA